MNDITPIRRVDLEDHEVIARQLEQLAKEIREKKQARTAHLIVVDVTGMSIERYTCGQIPSYSNTLGHLEFAKLMTWGERT